MENLVNVYFFGKRYQVPGDLTIMTAMEYAGYQLVRGCGCRNGFCGACATIYRIKGKNELKTCLACQTQVQEGMYVASIPFFPTDKRTYNINELKAEFYIPYAIDCMIKDGSGKTQLLSTPSRWFGVTFKEDRPGVVAKFQELADNGVYPTPLYNK